MTNDSRLMTEERARETVERAIRTLLGQAEHADGVKLKAVNQELAKKGNSGIYKLFGYPTLEDFIRRSCSAVEFKRPQILTIKKAKKQTAVPLQPRIPTEGVSIERPIVAERAPVAFGREVFRSALSEAWMTARFTRDFVEDGESKDEWLDLAFSHLENGDCAGVLSIVEPWAKPSLERLMKNNAGPVDLQVLIACCWSEGEEAALRGAWDLSAELLLLGVEISRSSGIAGPSAWRIAQVAAATFLGRQALASTPEVLAGLATLDLTATLAVLAGRAEIIGEDVAEELLGGKGELYFRVRDFVTNNLLHMPFLSKYMGSIKPREAEYKALSFLAKATRDLRAELVSIRDNIAHADLAAMEPYTNNLLGLIGRHKALLLSDETAAAASLEPLLSEARLRLINPRDATRPTLELLQIRKNYAEEALSSSDRLGKASVFASTVLRPIAERLTNLSMTLVEETARRQRPDLQIRHSTQKYPLGQPGRELDVQVEILNAGLGIAADVRLEVIRTPPEISLISQAFPIGTLMAGDSRTAAIPIAIVTSLQTLRCSVRLTCRDWTGEVHTREDEIVLADQTQEPDWDVLLAEAPYTLEPVEHGDRLWGRGAILNKLRVNTATLTSTIIWGQKRVGKTSIARVTFNELAVKATNLSLYVRRGDVSGLDEGGIAHYIATRLMTEAEKRKLLRQPVAVQRPQDFGVLLAGLTGAVDELREAGLTLPIILFFDEFDELDSSLFRGSRGDHFFATLRALTERRVVLVLIGSERIPAIFARYHQLMNKFDTLCVDAIEDTGDVLEMIKRPVRTFLEFDQQAAAEIADLSGRNPYYVNLVCTRVLHAMLTARRAHVDTADVRRAAQEIAADPAPTHWGHLWQDSDADEPSERRSREVESALVLSAFAAQHGQRAVPAKDLFTYLYSELGDRAKALQDGGALDRLVSRRVLHVEKDIDPSAAKHSVAVHLFRLWLNENAKISLAPVYKPEVIGPKDVGLSAAATASVAAYEFPVSDDELAVVSEGMTYRTKPVDVMQLKHWLRQFQNDTRIVLMFKLLTVLRKRYYYSDVLVTRAMDKAYDTAIRLAVQAGVKIQYIRTSKVSSGYSLKGDYLKRDESAGRVANIFVSYFGGALKSGAEVARTLKKSKRLLHVGDFRRALEWLESRTEPSELDQRFVAVVDDFVGSGYQFRSDALPLLRQKTKTDAIEKAVLAGRLVYIPLWAYRQGVETIQSDLPSLKVEPVNLLDESDQAFNPQSGVFDDDAERRMAETICRQLGQQLSPDSPLGWEGLQSLVIFNVRSRMPRFQSYGVLGLSRSDLGSRCSLGEAMAIVLLPVIRAIRLSSPKLRERCITVRCQGYAPRHHRDRRGQAPRVQRSAFRSRQRAGRQARPRRRPPRHRS